ncbi:hypothetical protein NKG94_02105 [Micromonospora sp. M12]
MAGVRERQARGGRDVARHRRIVLSPADQRGRRSRAGATGGRAAGATGGRAAGTGGSLGSFRGGVARSGGAAAGVVGGTAGTRRAGRGLLGGDDAGASGVACRSGGWWPGRAVGRFGGVGRGEPAPSVVQGGAAAGGRAVFVFPGQGSQWREWRWSWWTPRRSSPRR